MRSIKELKNIRGKRVLVRVDFNVPILKSSVHSHQFTVTDDTRMQTALPTIQFLLGKGAKVILMSHFGRPAVKRESRIMNHELRVVVERLEELLNKKVDLVEKWDFAEIGELVKKLKNGQVIMLPNLRLHPGEEKNSYKFARSLAELGDIYVNEAFSVSHRKHASLVQVAKLLPHAAGFHFEKEISILSKIVKDSRRPFIAIIGGSKVIDKLAMVKTLCKKADAVLIGSMLANHLFKSAGFGVGASMIDSKALKLAKSLLKNKKIIVPRDVVIGKSDGSDAVVVDTGIGVVAASLRRRALCKKPYSILDIGPKTILQFSHYIKTAKTLLWVGPMGYYEVKQYAHGTMALAYLFASRSKGKAFGVIGGGETIDALSKTNMLRHIDWVSTGGGALLKYLAGEKLPGLVALNTINNS